MTDNTERRGRRTDALTRTLRDIESWETTFPVHSTSRFSESGVFECYGERVLYGGKTSDAFLDCQRGASRGVGGSAARHIPGGSDVVQANQGDYTVYLNGTPVSARPGLNITTGPGISATVADDPVSEFTTLTIGGGVPTGTVASYAGSTAPDTWYIADGSLVSRIDDAALFAVIGTTYGVGDGSTTFGLPDLQSRVIFGLDTGNAANDELGETGGARTVALTYLQSGLPSHTHPEQYPLRSGSVLQGGGSRNDINSASTTTGANSVQNASQAHENMPPFVTLNYIIKR